MKSGKNKIFCRDKILKNNKEAPVKTHFNAKTIYFRQSNTRAKLQTNGLFFF